MNTPIHVLTATIFTIDSQKEGRADTFALAYGTKERLSSLIRAFHNRTDLAKDPDIDVLERLLRNANIACWRTKYGALQTQNLMLDLHEVPPVDAPQEMR